MVNWRSGLRFMLTMPMIYHNIVSISNGPCSRPDDATATLATASVWEQVWASSHCVLNNSREPLSFGLKVVAELITGIVIVPSVDVSNAVLREAGLRGSYLAAVVAANMYWGGGQAQGGAGEGGEDEGPSEETVRICAMHRRMAEGNAGAQPPTFFEILRLDPREKPLWPPQMHGFHLAPGHQEAIRAITKAYAEQVGERFLQLVGRYQTIGDGTGTAGEGVPAELLKDASLHTALEISAVTRLLLDDAARQQYMKKFLPALMGADLRITWENAKDRKAALENLCPGTYKRG